jgi:ABC-2 type transport system permease protein
MKPYFALLKARAAVLFQYRSAALAGIGTQIFWGILTVMILEAFYLNAGASEPLTLEQAIIFIWIVQAFLLMMPWNLDKEIEAQIRSGNVSYELLRPINLYGYWYLRSLAMRFIPTLMRCLPVLFFAAIFYAFPLPVSWAAGIGFIASIALGLLLASAITTLIIISLFWTISGEGIQRLMPHFTVILSGALVPLPLFPEWMQPFLSVQPFRGVLDIPSRIYTGVIPEHEILFYLAFQGLWTLLIVLAGKRLIRRAMKHFVIQGG